MAGHGVSLSGREICETVDADFGGKGKGTALEIMGVHHLGGCGLDHETGGLDSVYGGGNVGLVRGIWGMEGAGGIGADEVDQSNEGAGR